MKGKDIDNVRLPQVFSSLLSGVSAVISLYIVMLVVNFVGITTKIRLQTSQFVLVFAVFFFGDILYSKLRKPKIKKRDRKYPLPKK
jgi:uncharacterized membrane protein